jgi:glutamate synthase (NADPH) large chain
VLESGEAREVHHHCLLIGYGADAINPYIAFESLAQARKDGILAENGPTRRSSPPTAKASPTACSR